MPAAQIRACLWAIQPCRYHHFTGVTIVWTALKAQSQWAHTFGHGGLGAAVLNGRA